METFDSFVALSSFDEELFRAELVYGLNGGSRGPVYWRYPLLLRSLGLSDPFPVLTAPGD